MKISRALALAGCVGLALSALPTTGAAADAVTSVVVLRPAKGAPTISTWGLDLKQTGAGDVTSQINGPGGDAYISSVFDDGTFDLVRIPVRPDLPVTVHGSLNPFYQRYAAAVRHIHVTHPGVQVFASKVSVECASPLTHCKKGETQAPDYPPRQITDDHGDLKVRPGWYATYLDSLLVHLDAAGAHVDVLGPDNEGDTNSGPANHTQDNGDLTGSDFKTLLKDLRDPLRAKHPSLLPRISALDSAEPDGGYLKTVDDAGVDYAIASTHFNSQKYDCEAKLLHAFQAQAKGGTGEIWDTELHYTNLLNPEVARKACARAYLPSNPAEHRNPGFLSAKLALISAFQGFQHGVTGDVWWSYQPGSCSAQTGDTRSQIMSALVTSTSGAQRLLLGRVPDELKTAKATFNAYGFVNGTTHRVHLWMINDTGSPRTEALNLPPTAYPQGSAITTSQWHDFADPHGTKTANAHCDPAVVGMTGKEHTVALPPESVTLVTLSRP